MLWLQMRPWLGIKPGCNLIRGPSGGVCKGGLQRLQSQSLEIKFKYSSSGHPPSWDITWAWARKAFRELDYGVRTRSVSLNVLIKCLQSDGQVIKKGSKTNIEKQNTFYEFFVRAKSNPCKWVGWTRWCLIFDQGISITTFCFQNGISANVSPCSWAGRT